MSNLGRAFLVVPVFLGVLFSSQAFARSSAYQSYTKKLASRIVNPADKYSKNFLAPLQSETSQQSQAVINYYEQSKSCLRNKILRDAGNGSLSRDPQGRLSPVYYRMPVWDAQGFLLRQTLYARMDALTGMMGAIRYDLIRKASGESLISDSDQKVLSAAYLALLYLRQNIYTNTPSACSLWERWKSDGFWVDPRSDETAVYNRYLVSPREQFELYSVEQTVMALVEWLQNHGEDDDRFSGIVNIINPREGFRWTINSLLFGKNLKPPSFGPAR